MHIILHRLACQIYEFFPFLLGVGSWTESTLFHFLLFLGFNGLIDSLLFNLFRQHCLLIHTIRNLLEFLFVLSFHVDLVVVVLLFASLFQSCKFSVVNVV